MTTIIIEKPLFLFLLSFITLGIFAQEDKLKEQALEEFKAEHYVDATNLLVELPISVVIVGPEFVCPSESHAVLYALVNPLGLDVTYQWYGYYDGIIDTLGTAPSQAISNIPSPVPYLYNVRVTDVESGYSILSDTHAVVVSTLPVIAITADKTEICAGDVVMLAAAVQGSSLTCQWYANGMEISGATASVLYHYPTVTTDYTFTAAIPGSECVAHSITVTVTVKEADTTSISDKHIDAPEKIGVYPNPTTGKLRIDNYELRIEDIMIFDIYGRTLLSFVPAEYPETTVDLSHLSAGVYFVKIRTKTNDVVRKVLKE